MGLDDKIFEVIKTIDIDYLLNKDRIYPLLHPRWYKNSDNTISLISYYYRKSTSDLYYTQLKNLTEGQLQKERISNNFGVQYGTIITIDFTFQDVRKSGIFTDEININDGIPLDLFLAPYLRKIKLSKISL